MAVCFGDADHYANAQPALVDAIDKQPANRVVRQGRRRGNRRGHDHHSNATLTRCFASIHDIAQSRTISGLATLGTIIAVWMFAI